MNGALHTRVRGLRAWLHRHTTQYALSVVTRTGRGIKLIGMEVALSEMGCPLPRRSATGGLVQEDRIGIAPRGQTNALSRGVDSRRPLWLDRSLVPRGAHGVRPLNTARVAGSPGLSRERPAN